MKYKDTRVIIYSIKCNFENFLNCFCYYLFTLFLKKCDILIKKVFMYYKNFYITINIKKDLFNLNIENKLKDKPLNLNKKKTNLVNYKCQIFRYSPSGLIIKKFSTSSNFSSKIIKENLSNNKEYKTKNYVFNYIHISYLEFLSENGKNLFIQNLVKVLKLNTRYSILFKISCDNNLNFKMCGPQIGVLVEDSHNLEFYEDLYNVILLRIESTYELYDYLTEINALELMISEINIPEKIELQNVNSLKPPKGIINSTLTKKSFNNKLLPLTTNFKFYGIPILFSDREKYIELITKNNSNFKFEDKDKLFLYNNLLVKSNKNLNLEKSKNVIIISREVDENNILRIVFDEKTGILILKAEDIFINKNENIFKRKIGNVSIVFSSKLNTIMEINSNIKLKYIEDYDIYKKIKHEKNNKIGVFDLETFIDTDLIAKVYALGYVTNLDKIPQMFYLTDFLNNNNEFDYDLLIKTCLDQMLVEQFNNYNFYVHNLGRYDIVFLYKFLLKYNNLVGFNYYNLKTIFRDQKILKLEIKISKEKKIIKINFIDSLNLLNNDLNSLTKDFNLNFEKGKFPYSFVNKNTLNYIGETPSIVYYENISNLEYNKLKTNNWNLKEQTLKYLKTDLNCLFLIMNKFSDILWLDHNTEMTQALTITRLALNIYFKNFYKHNIPLINKKHLFNFINEAYFGGINEVYIPYGKNLKYIDINSLYPFAALNPMPGNTCEYLERLDGNELELDNLFGVFFAEVYSNTNNYLGLLPLRDKNKIIYPVGKFSGIWTTIELSLAKKEGYQIKIIKGYHFNKNYNLFDSFFDKYYNLKSTSSGPFKYIAKSIMNNLLGRFGLNMTKPVTGILNKEKRDYIATTRIIKSQKIIHNDQFLLTFLPEISPEICIENGVDYQKVLNNEFSDKNMESKIDTFDDISIIISTFTNSYARTHMNNIKLDILKNGGKIYYTDNDSLVVDNTYFNPLWISPDIGKFKLEYFIKEAYFISNKTYCLVLENNKVIIKAKGILSNSLSLEDFKVMYWNNLNVKAFKSNTKLNYEKGHVLIEKKKVNLNYNSYTHRTKVFNEKGIWINTKPIII